MFSLPSRTVNEIISYSDWSNAVERRHFQGLEYMIGIINRRQNDKA